MAEHGNRDAIDRWYTAFNAKNFQELAAILSGVADSDVIQEWPQSGERIKGRDNIIAILENYPGLPDATVEHVHGIEDRWGADTFVDPFASHGLRRSLHR